ncbi:MAG: hypothetical protein HC835_09970 [Oscillatoriales cyanobacterium RM2_1_1]|nr:hypothetical protein [Oscillatoriales cyanobacterium SM2_3_0]NJO45926.1 hypothetical protein [Oscillatoriales cyanobacterium RM2_1_1]
MNQSPRSNKQMFTQLFWVLTGVILSVWILRGLGILTFLPGIVLWLLLLLTIGTGVLSQMSR